jgi:hypothetical protein
MSFFTEKVLCSECHENMVTVTAAMERVRENLFAENPKADIAFVCPTCERELVGPEAFDARQQNDRRMN